MSLLNDKYFPPLRMIFNEVWKNIFLEQNLTTKLVVVLSYKIGCSLKLQN